MVELHNDDKGCIAEAAFRYECFKRSIFLFAPVKPTSRLDFIALRDDGSPVKIQVKWICISVNLRLKGPSPGRPGDGAQSLS